MFGNRRNVRADHLSQLTNAAFFSAQLLDEKEAGWVRQRLDYSGLRFQPAFGVSLEPSHAWHFSQITKRGHLQ